MREAVNQSHIYTGAQPYGCVAECVCDRVTNQWNQITISMVGNYCNMLLWILLLFRSIKKARRNCGKSVNANIEMPDPYIKQISKHTAYICQLAHSWGKKTFPKKMPPRTKEWYKINKNPSHKNHRRQNAKNSIGIWFFFLKFESFSNSIANHFDI